MFTSLVNPGPWSIVLMPCLEVQWYSGKWQVELSNVIEVQHKGRRGQKSNCRSYIPIIMV